MRGRELLTISLPPAFMKDVERAAKKEHRTKSELVREALRQYLARERQWEALRRYGAEAAQTKGVRSEEDVARIVKEYRREQTERKSKSS